MIDFACNQFDIKEIIKCSLGLTKSEFEILEYLLQIDIECDTVSLSKKTKLELSTIQRTLKKLVDKDLVSRRQMNLSQGGYLFVYKIKDKSHIKKKILEIIHEWNSKVETEIKMW